MVGEIMGIRPSSRKRGLGGGKQTRPRGLLTKKHGATVNEQWEG